MKDVTLKSLTSEDRKRREFSITEIKEADGVQTRTDKRWIYSVSVQVKTSEVGGLRKWMRARTGRDESSNLKNLSIFKSHDSKLQANQYICNAMGELFIVTEKYLLVIEFFYLLRIEALALSCKK